MADACTVFDALTGVFAFLFGVSEYLSHSRCEANSVSQTLYLWLWQPQPVGAEEDAVVV